MTHAEQPPHHFAGSKLDGDNTSVEASPDPHAQIFSVTGFSRNDLQERLKFTDEEISQLDDAAMYHIARIIEDHYVELSFWSDLDFATRHVLEQQQKQHHTSHE